jgi:hypothetical protein
MLMTWTRTRGRMAVGGCAALAALLIVAGVSSITAAGAPPKTLVSYDGRATNLKPGQSQGLPVLIGFDLRGKGCPSGPDCFDRAEVRHFNAVSWAYPNCPEVLDNNLEFAGTQRVGKAPPHRFRASGPSDSFASTQIKIEGKLLKHGRLAKGWFTASEAGCTTGRIEWTARPNGSG